MLRQKDNSISISYVDYDDPQLFAQLYLAHINISGPLILFLSIMHGLEELMMF